MATQDNSRVEIRKNRFVMHSHGNNKAACYYFDVYKKTNIEDWGEWYECNPENYVGILEAIENTYLGDVSKTSELYVTQFDKNGLVFSTLNVPDYADMSDDAKGTLNNLGINGESDRSEIIFGYAYFTNGFGEEYENKDACQAAVSSWPGFNSWDIAEAKERFFPEQQ